MDVELAGQAQGVHQPLEGPTLALVARIDLGVHQVQHGPEPAGRDADLVQLLLVLGPVRGVQQLLQARQPNLEGAMKQDRQFGWVHQMILSVFRKSEKLA